MLRHMIHIEIFEALTKNKPILIYDEDNREGETDIVLPANNITSRQIYMLRSEAGGLICVAIHPSIAKIFAIPYLSEALGAASIRYPILSEIIEYKTPYGDPPAFSLTINHRDTYTGVTDNDRALTMRELAKLVQEALKYDTPEPILRKKFIESFKSPGHVHLLIGKNNLLKFRKGHTELSLALTELYDLLPVMVICEMLDGETGKALSKDKTVEYAKRNGIPYIEGEDIIKAYTEYKISLIRRSG